jgi:hypothetical protein
MPGSLGAAERAVEVGDPTRINTPSTPAFDELSSHRRDHASTTPRRVMTQTYVHGDRSTAMRLADHEARARLESHDHGILCTVHAERGVDAVPVAYAVDDDGYVGVPIDRVKPKASLRLQRERNLEADPRATLLVEHWDRSDWSRLWWVRAELRWQGDTAASRAAALAARLAGRYPQYQDQPFARVLVLHIVGVAGWAADDR